MKPYFQSIPLLILFLFPIFLHAGNNDSLELLKGPKKVHIGYTDQEMRVDGFLVEKAWKNAEIATGFFQRFPADTSLAQSQTEVKLLYDDNFIYLGVICYDEVEGKYVANSMRRDFESRGTDFFSVMIDPFNDQINAFEFMLTPYGAQREALISNGGNGRDASSTSWDNKWYSKVKRYDGKWVIEMAIPFNTLRYKEGSTEWRINFARDDYKRNERTNWSWIPRNFRNTNLAYTGVLIWDKPLKKPGKNISVIPFISGGITDDYEDSEPKKITRGIGGDVKVGLTSSLNLDLTFNPDFSQVEVDRQVTNLDRFEITFPERRQFFLENADLFASFGTEGIRPFFSRRIGLAKDSATSETVPNQILAGARLSGKISKNLRVGLLNVQTANDDELGIPSTNYTVAAVQRQVFGRSYIGAFLINKHSVHTPKDSAIYETYFDRVAGMDFNLATNNNKWVGKLFYHQNLMESDPTKAFAAGTNLRYNSARLEMEWDHQMVGDNYVSQVGFIRRSGYQRMAPRVEIKFYPKSKVLNYHGPEIENEMIWANEVGLSDRTSKIRWAFRFAGTTYLSIGYENAFVKLIDNFDPTRTEGPELAAGTEYSTHSMNFFYISDYRKPYSFFLRGNLGQYYNGFRAGLSGDASYRFPPYAVLSANFSINQVNLPKPYNSATLLLLGPKIDLTLANNLFISTLVQYNNQIDNININARFQWRFKPVSDLFIVYTDNYYASHLNSKNRGLIFKLTYWLNV
ncbi:MAG: carbohydrate binding family 9 domain-containing protein [Bacteroidetes bacterium]|nr:carbohydrate binding family 9 domain-containing protein [Bacteroidota bacterium]